MAISRPIKGPLAKCRRPFRCAVELLESRVLFTATSFQQVAQGTAGGFPVYLWSNASNWTNGIPGGGAIANVNISALANPSGYDDIASLTLSTLNLAQGSVAVGGSLTLDSMSFGTSLASVYSDSILTGTPTALTIDGFAAGTIGRVGAFGSNALTTVLAATDPGEIYQADEGGELVLTATPLAAPDAPVSAGFYYQNSHGAGQLPSGTFAFSHPGATVSSLIEGVAVGDSIALPGSSVTSVVYGANSLTVTTNLGTTTLNDVQYLAGSVPVTYSAAPDPLSGLERITFTTPQNTSLQQVAQGTAGGFPVYLWSNASNWTNGIPGGGAIANVNISALANPSGYDDIASLTLSTLNLAQGSVAVGGSLTLDSMSFGTSLASVYSDSILTGTPTALTIDGFAAGTIGRVGAFGSNALTTVLAATDPGEIYQADEGGELVLTAAPLAAPDAPVSAGFYYQNSHGAGQLPSGTFAFSHPGATVSSLIEGVAVGDSIALPGSSVTSVVYGANSLTVTTNLGTTTLNDVQYLAGSVPVTYSAAPDPLSGLERITFTTPQNTSFQQVAQGTAGGFPVYLWSNASNWTNGIPGGGAIANVNISALANPSGYDDIASLTLSTLNLAQGSVAVGGSLTLDSMSFGTSLASVYSDSILTGTPTALTIDGFAAGSIGRVGTFGSNALTTVLAATDPGEIYQADEGGELVLTAAPLAAPDAPVSAGFYYQNSHGAGQLPSGTFAFSHPGATVSSLIEGVAVGDSIALPGSSVTSVVYGANSLTVTTNLGTTTLNDVQYLAGSVPVTYSAAPDPLSGLERITFTTPQNTSLQQVAQGTAGGFPVYLWSNASNWTNGIPGGGAIANVNISALANPSGYDDIASLTLSTLNLAQGSVAVGGSLTLDSMSFGTSLASVYSDSILTGTPTALTIDGFAAGTIGRVGAFGSNALTTVLAATDPGEIYQADEGGELVLTATPLAAPDAPVSAGFYYQNSHGAGQLPSGTFAFSHPGATVSSLIEGVAVGDSIALPGSSVTSVVYGANSLTVTTNLGTTTLNDVQYLAGSVPVTYSAAPDPLSGLERITFTTPQNTSFQQVAQGTAGGFPVYLWSNASNWTNGIPGGGAIANVNISALANPSGYDDIASLTLSTLNLAQGSVAVGGSLTLDSMSFGTSLASVYSDSILTGTPTALTIDGFAAGSIGRVGTFGSNALTTVLAATDPGEIYQADEGGELVLTAAPLAAPDAPVSAGFYYQNSHGAGQLPSGTFAFSHPGATVSSLIEGVAVGDSIALPGSSVTSVVYGANSLTVTTNLGTTTLNDVQYLAGSVPVTYSAAPDPLSGLERITFTGYPSTVAAINLFYDNSKFNKNIEGVGTSDDMAIDTSKTAYLPGTGTANFSNISAFNNGINGIMVDLAGRATHTSITASDFTFKVGLNNTPSTWAAAPNPSAVSVRFGAGTGGVDRVEITWTDGSIKEEWLEVTVLADASTGLTSPYTFFYGSVIANSGTGDTGALATTNATDENAARAHGGTATVTNVFDYNKDGFVNSSDENAARGYGGTVKFIKIASNTSLESNSTVAAVNLFYDNSKFNKDVAGVGLSDDKAIDPSKTAYLPGAGTTNFSNISAFTDGINGVMVDLTPGGAHGNLNASDFTFKIGLNNAPNQWDAAPTPSTVSVRTGAGVSGADRVEITWTDGSIKEEWLEVTVHADPNTGLSTPYTFFYGSVIGNTGTGDTNALAITSSTDENAARSHGGSATVTNVLDFNKDGFVNSSDENAARGNGATVKFIKIAANTPLVPNASPSVAPDLSVVPAVTAPPASRGGDTGLASGLISLLNSVKTRTLAPLRLDWLASRLENVNPDSSVAATIFEALATADTKLTRSILVEADKVADELGLDDSLLDSILVDLGLV